MFMDLVLMLHAGAEGSGVVLFQGAAEEVEVENMRACVTFFVASLHRHYSNPDLLSARVARYRLDFKPLVHCLRPSPQRQPATCRP